MIATSGGAPARAQPNSRRRGAGSTVSVHHRKPPVTTIPVRKFARCADAVCASAASFAKVPPSTGSLRMHVLVQIGLVVLFIGVALLRLCRIRAGSPSSRYIGAGGGRASGIAGWPWQAAAQRTVGVQAAARCYSLPDDILRLRAYELLPVPLAFGIFVALGAAGCVAGADPERGVSWPTRR